MKLLLSLILLITIAINCAQSVAFIPNHRGIGKLGQQQCYTSNSPQITGHSSGFIQVGYNSNFQSNDGSGSGSGSIEQLSYFEEGLFDVDYPNQQIYVSYLFDANADPSHNGQVWGFGKNSTQYVQVNVNGVDYCFKQPLGFNIPNAFDLEYVGDSQFSTVDVEIFQGPNPLVIGNFSSQQLVVNKQDCSIMASNTRNINSPVGFEVLNFYNFVGSPDESLLQLPLICLNTNQPSTKKLTRQQQQLRNKVEKSIKLPKIVNNFPL